MLETSQGFQVVAEADFRLVGREENKVEKGKLALACELGLEIVHHGILVTELLVSDLTDGLENLLQGSIRLSDFPQSENFSLNITA